MQEQIRQALDDLVLLSQTLSTHDQQHVLKTILIANELQLPKWVV